MSVSSTSLAPTVQLVKLEHSQRSPMSELETSSRVSLIFLYLNALNEAPLIPTWYERLHWEFPQTEVTASPQSFFPMGPMDSYVSDTHVVTLHGLCLLWAHYRRAGKAGPLSGIQSWEQHTCFPDTLTLA